MTRQPSSFNYASLGQASQHAMLCVADLIHNSWGFQNVCVNTYMLVEILHFYN